MCVCVCACAFAFACACACACVCVEHSFMLYLETRPPVIWTGKNEYGRVQIWVDGWWTGKK